MRSLGSTYAVHGEKSLSGGKGGRGGKDGIELPKPKLEFKKMCRQIWALVEPRKGLMLTGILLIGVNRIAGMVLPYVSKNLMDKVLTPLNPHPEKLLDFVLVVFVAMAVQGVTSYVLNMMLSSAGQSLIAEMRRKVQEHVGKLPVAFYDENRTGALVARIMSDVEGVRNLIGPGLVELLGGFVTAALAFVYLMSRSVSVTLVVFAVLALFLLVIKRVMRHLRPLFRERGRINAEVTGRLTESVGGVRVVKGYHAEAREARTFADGVQRMLDNSMKSIHQTSLIGSASTSVLGLVSALVMWLGSHAVLDMHWTIGDYVSYNLFLSFMIAPVFQMANVGTQMSEAMAGLDRTNEILNEVPENETPGRTEKMQAIHGDVKFQDVRFSYEQGKEVLHGVSFDAPSGTVTALVGSSGSGKSTVISLVCGFHNPTEGQVAVDGIDLARVDLDTFRSQLGVVLQESFLFDGTIRENILFSRPGATEEEFLYACKTARVDEFAERFPEKYETMVGERGVKLSGGQKQRLSIARALLAAPRILILDEATSSLDSESEAMIQAGLNNLMQGRTTFVIAHRLSTIRRADQILVVEEGQIVERGNHSELLAKGGRYHDLYTRQHGLEANLFLAPGEGDTTEEKEEDDAS